MKIVTALVILSIIGFGNSAPHDQNLLVPTSCEEVNRQFIEAYFYIMTEKDECSRTDFTRTDLNVNDRLKVVTYANGYGLLEIDNKVIFETSTEKVMFSQPEKPAENMLWYFRTFGNNEMVNAGSYTLRISTAGKPVITSTAEYSLDEVTKKRVTKNCTMTVLGQAQKDDIAAWKNSILSGTEDTLDYEIAKYEEYAKGKRNDNIMSTGQKTRPICQGQTSEEREIPLRCCCCLCS